MFLVQFMGKLAEGDCRHVQTAVSAVWGTIAATWFTTTANLIELMEARCTKNSGIVTLSFTKYLALPGMQFLLALFTVE